MRALILVSLVVATITAAPTISIRTEFKVGPEPATFTVRIDIDPRPENRKACLEYDGGDYSRSCWDIDGTSAGHSEHRLRNLSAGEYVLRATVIRADGSISVATTQVLVTSSGPDEEDRE